MLCMPLPLRLWWCLLSFLPFPLLPFSYASLLPSHKPSTPTTPPSPPPFKGAPGRPCRAPPLLRGLGCRWVCKARGGRRSLPHPSIRPEAAAHRAEAGLQEVSAPRVAYPGHGGRPGRAGGGGRLTSPGRRRGGPPCHTIWAPTAVAPAARLRPLSTVLSGPDHGRHTRRGWGATMGHGSKWAPRLGPCIPMSPRGAPPWATGPAPRVRCPSS
jgi:hypothetical protein